MKGIAIITARGASKRIPRKNIKEFFGKLIIAYSIEAALKSRLFDEVMVSTEDREIAEVARAYGASVPFYRSMETADDQTGTDEVLLEVLNEYKKRGACFDWLCCIYPTAPFLTPDKLVECETQFREGNADGLIPVVRFSYPPQRGFVIGDQRRLEYKWAEYANERSQDMEILYHDAGQFYFLRSDAFLREKTLPVNNTIPHVLHEWQAHDIDSAEDWKIAELKYRYCGNMRTDLKEI